MIKIYKLIQILILTSLFSQHSIAQLTGVKSIPGNYANIASAITDLNTQGVGAGGVVFNIGAGISYTETAPSGGFYLGSATLNATLTSANKLKFQKASTATANPVITSYTGGTGTPATAVQDGVFKIVGCDFVTINGINLIENVSNITAATMMEFGFGLLKLSATDGCQHDTIMNCIVTLSRTNNSASVAPMAAGSNGILMINATPASQTTALVITVASGTNSYNAFYGNTIQQCNNGISLIGFASTTVNVTNDTGNDVGGSSASTGNTILNFGGVAAASTNAMGINAINQYGFNYSYNTINNNNGSGGNHIRPLFGISNSTGTGASGNILHNTVTLKIGANTLAISHYAISSNTNVVAGITNAVNANYNKVINCTWTTATLSGTFAAISVTGATTITMKYDTISNTNFSGNFSCNGIYGFGATTIYADSNAVSGFYIPVSSSSTAYFYGINLNAPTVFASHNSITNITIKGTVIGMQGGGGSLTFTYNTMRNFSSTGNGVFALYTLSTTTIANLSYNIISKMNLTGTSGTVGGLYSFSNNTAAYIKTITGNTIDSLTSNISAVYALMCENTPIISENKIYNITSNATSSYAFTYGIYVSNLFNGSVPVISNNYIGDLNAPFSTNPASDFCIAGIFFPVITGTSSTIKVYFNTVYMNATSTGANFSTAAIYHTTNATSTIARLDMRNNIFINTSTPTGTGVTAAYRRSDNVLSNYFSSSDNNLFYAGAPGTAHLIYFDGTNSSQTLSAFQSLVAPRETNSKTELPPFVSTAGPSTSYLHINWNIANLVESNAINISGITDDYDGEVRQGNAGYNGMGTAPDIGADEFNPSISLPIELVAFNAVAEINTAVQTTWITETEINSRYFLVEKSSDGNVFEELYDTVTAAGNSINTLEYNLVDNTPYIGLSYYRLKAVDLDGSISYSPIVAVNITRLEIVNVYPNPTNGGDLTIDINSETSDATVEIINVLGQIVYQEKFVLSNGKTFLHVPTRQLAMAEYFLKITLKNKEFKQKIFVR